MSKLKSCLYLANISKLDSAVEVVELQKGVIQKQNGVIQKQKETMELQEERVMRYEYSVVMSIVWFVW